MGREFLDLFQDWADSYDDSVEGKDIEYKEVFSNYEGILDAVAEKSFGTVLEFGPGTGNLTNKLLSRGLAVIPVEPSPEMRAIGKQKIGDRAEFRDGDFLEFQIEESIDTIVSTYAFHHLTDEEKSIAIEKYSNLLSMGGKIVFADTMFETERHFKGIIQASKDKGFLNLAEDLEREYYTTIPVLEGILQDHGFSVTFTKQNAFVWLMEAEKIN